MIHFYCKFKGHDLKPLATGSATIQEFECSQCKQHFTVYGNGKLVRLTKYWKQNHPYVTMHFSPQKNVAS